MKKIIVFLFLAASFALQAQTPGLKRIESFEVRSKMDPSFKELPLRSIGPTVMSGRVTDIAWNPDNPSHFYVAYASGGLWVTYNMGTTFEPIMDELPAMTIGAIAVDWQNNVIWVGTGENNSSRSSYSGVGIYCSEDNGTTWKYKGLPESHHIGKIIVHPNDRSVVYVAALGHLYSPNKERGVYKTTDGGNTWTHQLFVDENTGAIDLEINPKNPDELIASMWYRTRRAWNFEESGASSGIYHTQSGGAKWEKINTAPFPTNEGTGRIGVAFQEINGEKLLYASVDNQNKRPRETKEDEKAKLRKTDFIKMKKEEFLALDTALLNPFLKENYFPEKLTSDSLKKLIAADKYTPAAIYDYLFDANEDLFNTPVIGLEIYKYNFQDKKWTKTHDKTIDDVVYSYGYYFGLMEIHPTKPQQLYTAGVPLITSDDGGKTWRGINPGNVHVDHHVIRFHEQHPDWILNGSDGGVQISFDNGATFVNCKTPAVGQFYTVQVDNEKPYNVYGGLQDNGVWKGPSTNVPSRDWMYEGAYPFKSIMGGDGMQVQVDPRNHNIVYTGYQFGNYARLDLSTSDFQEIHPEHSFGERPLRYNWQTPILISPHQPDIFYICSNKVHRSTNAGNTFQTISGDLTAGPKEGDVPFGTLTAIDESTLQLGWIAVGADDGSVHISSDAGSTWKNVSKTLPKKYVSRIIFSTFKKERLYLAMNGYREDDMTPYLYVSDDLGVTWKSINTGLPFEPINVIREDDTNENILYIGTDNGLYVSLDKGNQWRELGNLPNVAVHDMVIQKREQELVIATHGRSLWIADLKPIRANQQQEFSILLKNKYRYHDLENISPNWYDPRNTDISLLYKSQKVNTIAFKDSEGKVVATYALPSTGGQWLEYHIKQNETFHLPKGKLTVDGNEIEVK